MVCVREAYHRENRTLPERSINPIWQGVGALLFSFDTLRVNPGLNYPINEQYKSPGKIEYLLGIFRCH
jgi:hypothetical protein